MPIRSRRVGIPFHVAEGNGEQHHVGIRIWLIGPDNEGLFLHGRTYCLFCR
jgi:hypothetical protein